MKITLAAAFAAGYVLGARAGRGRYEEIRRRFDSVWGDPKVQGHVSDLGEAAKSAAAKVQDSAASAASSVKDSASSAAAKVQDSASSTAASVKDKVSSDDTLPPVGDDLEEEGPLSTSS